MNITVDKHSSGFESISLELSNQEIDTLVESLLKLKNGSLGHFHIRNNDFDSDGPIADIEFSRSDNTGNQYLIE